MSTDDVIERRSNAQTAFLARRKAMAKYAFYPFRDVNKPRTEIALIWADPQGRTFVMDSRPWMMLESGTKVECYGDLVGEWEVTTQKVTGRKGKVLSLWRNKATQQETHVRVDDRMMPARTLITRIRTTWHSWKQRVICSRASLTSMRLPDSSYLDT